MPGFRVTGKLYTATCAITMPFTGEIVVESSEMRIKSVELQLVRVETCGARRRRVARKAPTRARRKADDGGRPENSWTTGVGFGVGAGVGAGAAGCADGYARDGACHAGNARAGCAQGPPRSASDGCSSVGPAVGAPAPRSCPRHRRRSQPRKSKISRSPKATCAARWPSRCT